MTGAVLYQGGGFSVTEALLRTPRKSYKLSQIEYVSVERPLLLFATLPAAGVTGFTIGFWRYLEPGEGPTLIAVSLAAVLVSICFGTLRVHSLALRDGEVATSFGSIGRLRHVRAAIEKAMIARNQPGASS